MQAEPPPSPPLFLPPMSGSLKLAAGGGEQSLCRSLIVPLWPSVLTAQGHVGPRAPSHHNLRCGQILHTTHPPTPHTHPHPSLFLLTSILPHQHMLEVWGSNRLPASLQCMQALPSFTCFLFFPFWALFQLNPHCKCVRGRPLPDICVHTYTFLVLVVAMEL